MLKLFAALFVSAAIAQVVDLNSYLTFSTPQAASERSQQMCGAVGCDGVRTRCWWAVKVLSDGTAALRIEPGGFYGKTTTAAACAVGCGLTTTEQGLLKTAAQLGANITSSSTLDCP